MGAYSPVPAAPQDVVGTIMDTIIAPTLSELIRRDIEYRGVVYAGCMLTEDGPKLIEYNVRFGDPEAEVVLPRLRGDVTQLLYATASGTLTQPPEIDDEAAAVCVVLAAQGYPGSPHRGDRIHGVSEAGTVEGVTVYHAGTSFVDDALVSAGGRVLTVSALGRTILAARERAYEAAAMISFSGMQHRSDIANAIDVGEST
jgi:phosphoribosylamine--glycine ligase